MKYLLFFLLIFSCASNIKVKPNWIIQEPNSDDDYWVGIGIVEKPLKANYRELVNQLALNEIAQQINVQITGEATSVLQELNYKVDDYFSSVIKTRVNENIKFVEFVDYFESKNDYRGYARLSKEKYFQNLNQNRKNAIDLALNMIEKSKTMNVNSFKYLSSAFLEILPYIDLNLMVKNPYDSRIDVNLASFIKLRLIDYVSRAEIVAYSNPFQLKLLSKDGSIYKAKCIDKETSLPLSNVPVLIKLNDDSIGVNVMTNKMGELTINTTKIKEISKPYQISHSLNLPMLVDSSLIDMLKPMTQNSKVSFVLKGANLAMNASEKNLDETLEPPFISSAIKKYFNENFHSSFTNEENAEYTIKLNVYTKPRSEDMNEYGFYFVYAYAEITITETSSNKEV